jgi:hypothetical protein
VVVDVYKCTCKCSYFEIKISISQRSYWPQLKVFFAILTKECRELALIPSKTKRGD